ncbi:hypothetical protein TNCV_3339431 [Trichonephila clavipes]|nr:hypothetical protein TNCV_3339431 [Trichonephila clavipes]
MILLKQSRKRNKAPTEGEIRSPVGPCLKTSLWPDWNCSAVSLEKFVAVDDDNVCTVSIMAEKDILELVQSSQNNIDADSDYETEMNNVAPVPASFEVRNIKKSKFSYLDAHSKDEMNNRIKRLRTI